MFLLNQILMAACFVSFIWGAAKFFMVGNDGSRKGKRVVTIFGTLQMVCIAFAMSGDGAVGLQQGIAFLFLVVGFVVFWAAIRATRGKKLDFALSDSAPKRLIVHGPYRFVRHPIYLAYSLTWLAGFLASGKAYVLLPMAVLFGLYVTAMVKEERQFLASELGGDYREYMKRAGMMWPKGFGG